MKHLIIFGFIALVLAACATPVAQPQDLSVTYTTYGAFTMPQHAITTVTIDGRDVTIEHAYANGTVTSSIGYTASRDSIAALQSAISASDFPDLAATIEAPEPIPVADVGSANLTIERGDDRAHTVIELNYQPEMPADLARIVDAIYEVTMEAPQPEYEGQRAFEPMQCEQTPWDEWYSQGNIQYLIEPTQEQLITDYYGQVHDIEIRSVEERTRDGAVCEACNVCPQSTYYVAWIAGDDIEAIEDLGWGPVPTEPAGASDLEGSWTLISGTDGDGSFEAEATITFSDGRVSGSAPCNSYSGDVSIGTASVDFETLAQTERACLDQDQMESESRYFDTLRSVDPFELQEGVLVLSGDDRELRYVRESTGDEPIVSDPELYDDWRLTGGSIDGETVDFDASLEIENDRIGGSAPCNGYGADATFEDTDVMLGQIVSTMMYCEGQMDDESSYLHALEAVDSYAIDTDTLTLSGENLELVYERDETARTTVYFTDTPCEQNPEWYPQVGSSDVSSVEAYLADLGIDADVAYTSRGAVCKACLPSCAGSYVSADIDASETDALTAQGWVEQHPFPDEPVTSG